MKRIFLSILATVALTFSACEKNEPNEPNNPENPNQPGIESTENLAVTVNPDGTTSTGAPFQWIEGSHNSEFLLNYIKYKVDYANTQIFITGAEEKGLRDVMKGKALIPKTITINNVSHPITLVEKRAFYQCEEIKSINIPEGVTKIEESAFEECTNLTAAQLYNGLLEIEANAFKSCENLEFIQLPNSLTALGEYAFANCYKMELFNGSIPKIGRHLNEGVFLNCAAIKRAIIPETVESIGKYAFKGCSSLKEVDMTNMNNSYTTHIGESAFEDCTSLTKIEFSTTCTELEAGKAVFRNCQSIESIILPVYCTKIPEASFQGCSSLKYIKFNNYSGASRLYEYGIKHLGAFAFDGCTSLERLIISPCVEYIDWTALFRNCSSLKELGFIPGTSYYTPLYTTHSDPSLPPFENVYLENLILSYDGDNVIPEVKARNVYGCEGFIGPDGYVKNKYQADNQFRGVPEIYSNVQDLALSMFVTIKN